MDFITKELTEEEKTKKVNSLMPICCKLIFKDSKKDIIKNDSIVISSYFGYAADRIFDLSGAYLAVNCGNGAVIGNVDKLTQYNLLPTYGIDVAFLAVAKSVGDNVCDIVITRCFAIDGGCNILNVTIQDKHLPISVADPKFYISCPICGKYSDLKLQRGTCPECGIGFRVEGVRYNQVRIYAEQHLSDSEKCDIYKNYAVLRGAVDVEIKAVTELKNKEKIRKLKSAI